MTPSYWQQLLVQLVLFVAERNRFATRGPEQLLWSRRLIHVLTFSSQTSQRAELAACITHCLIIVRAHFSSWSGQEELVGQELPSKDALQVKYKPTAVVQSQSPLKRSCALPKPNGSEYLPEPLKTTPEHEEG